MKVTVKQVFIDKNNPGKKYFPGEVADFEKERAMELIEKGVVEGKSSVKIEDTAEVKKPVKRVQETPEPAVETPEPVHESAEEPE